MRIRLTIILLFAATICTGCFSSNPEDIRAFKKPQDIDVTMENYTLQPSDEIHISCSEISEIHDQYQKIRPDGKISFEMIGEIQAAGKTPAELSEDIRLKAIQLYKLTSDKPVDVLITAYQSKYFYVLGQVHLPGPRLYSGRDTASKAINLAQPNGLAWKERIQIIRPSSDPNIKPAIFELNYDRLMAHGEEDKDVLLQEGDIIYVPPTVLGWIALKIEEFVNPISRAFSGVYTVNRGMNNMDSNR
ncbi:MAG: polysaccharide biosynthesis/export family protein [Sedimentisphaerales bacterium]|nr:polysaccharide biosynthesis/export family protein [Sedimentisphaerales bacterium]